VLYVVLDKGWVVVPVSTESHDMAGTFFHHTSQLRVLASRSGSEARFCIEVLYANCVDELD
jgi:hypothetical protein